MKIWKFEVSGKWFCKSKLRNTNIYLYIELHEKVLKVKSYRENSLEKLGFVKNSKSPGL